MAAREFHLDDAAKACYLWVIFSFGVPLVFLIVYKFAVPSWGAGGFLNAWPFVILGGLFPSGILGGYARR